MSAALFIAVSLAASGACAVISWKHPAQVARATGGDLTALARSLRALPGEARLTELARRSPPESWERRLALEVMSAADPRAKIAAANDLLVELEQRLDAGAGWPRAAARLSALAALLLATLSFLARAGPSVIALVLVAGAAGAIASAAAGRVGRTAASRKREAVDALVGVALGPLDSVVRAASAPSVSPRRSRRARP
ncbi:hypothetical protein WMF28_29440 [Sorangium sp. So ce590]|uniref:hypothetical protein n=1 Tax=Sorangium sp. So ce590 TaxID=3133317 RepID=UPI003F645FE5